MSLKPSPSRFFKILTFLYCIITLYYIVTSVVILTVLIVSNLSPRLVNPELLHNTQKIMHMYTPLVLGGGACLAALIAGEVPCSANL